MKNLLKMGFTFSLFCQISTLVSFISQNNWIENSPQSYTKERENSRQRTISKLRRRGSPVPSRKGEESYMIISHGYIFLEAKRKIILSCMLIKHLEA